VDSVVVENMQYYCQITTCNNKKRKSDTSHVPIIFGIPHGVILYPDLFILYLDSLLFTSTSKAWMPLSYLF